MNGMHPEELKELADRLIEELNQDYAHEKAGRFKEDEPHPYPTELKLEHARSALQEMGITVPLTDKEKRQRGRIQRQPAPSHLPSRPVLLYRARNDREGQAHHRR